MLIERPDFGVFEGCFGDSKGQFTDLDAVCERRGKFLVLEFKTDGQPVPMGQRILFEQLLRIPGNRFRVCIVWGTKGPGDTWEPTKWQVMPAKGIEDCSMAKLRRYVGRWWAWVDTKSK